MRKMLIAAVLLVGCSGDDGPPQDPHELGACGSSWGSTGMCEAACEAKPANNADVCTATLTVLSGQSTEVACTEGTITHEGTLGCCLQIGGTGPDGVVFFAECLP